MKTRAITGVLFVIVMVGSFLLGNFVFDAFYLLLLILCLREFYSLVKQSGMSPNIILGLINGILIYLGFAALCYANMFALPVMYGSTIAYKLLMLVSLAIGAVFIQELFKKSMAPFTNIAYTFLGVILVGMPFTFFHAMAYIGTDFNFHYPLAFMILLWANDTGAYLVGMKFGRTKLFERHSPKKTWEGFIGGIAIGAGAALIISYYYKDLTWNQWVSIAILISCFGTLGDLVESMFKRSINVKDSGGLLPGHGGLLDRFDGLFIAAPVVYTYLYFILN